MVVGKPDFNLNSFGIQYNKKYVKYSVIKTDKPKENIGNNKKLDFAAEDKKYGDVWQMHDEKNPREGAGEFKHSQLPKNQTEVGKLLEAKRESAKVPISDRYTTSGKFFGEARDQIGSGKGKPAQGKRFSEKPTPPIKPDKKTNYHYNQGAHVNHYTGETPKPDEVAFTRSGRVISADRPKVDTEGVNVQTMTDSKAGDPETVAVGQGKNARDKWLKADGVGDKRISRHSGKYESKIKPQLASLKPDHSARKKHSKSYKEYMNNPDIDQNKKDKLSGIKNLDAQYHYINNTDYSGHQKKLEREKEKLLSDIKGNTKENFHNRVRTEGRSSTDSVRDGEDVRDDTLEGDDSLTINEKPKSKKVRGKKGKEHGSYQGIKEGKGYIKDKKLHGSYDQTRDRDDDKGNKEARAGIKRQEAYEKRYGKRKLVNQSMNEVIRDMNILKLDLMNVDKGRKKQSKLGKIGSSIASKYYQGAEADNFNDSELRDNIDHIRGVVGSKIIGNRDEAAAYANEHKDRYSPKSWEHGKEEILDRLSNAPKVTNELSHNVLNNMKYRESKKVSKSADETIFKAISLKLDLTTLK